MKILYAIPFILTFAVFLFLHHTPVKAQATSDISNCAASPFPITVKQADNSIITVIGKGNLQKPWTETLDGYTVVKNRGIYEYATKANGRLIPSGVAARNATDRQVVEKAFLQRTTKSLKPDDGFAGARILFPKSTIIQVPQGAGFLNTGNARTLLLLIKYPDLPNTHKTTDFNNLMNQANYRGTGSFKDFFSASSYGKLNISTDVFGWYTAANNYEYYGYQNGYDRSAQLVKEAIDAAEAAGVDFSRYDNNNDGEVDGIIVVHAGPGAEEGSQFQYIWSNRWALSAVYNQVYYDGKVINDYVINAERRIFTNDMIGIGVMCHEFGHILNLPDLYDSNGGSEGVGEWSLMASACWLGNEHTPGNMCAWCKNKLGWINPTVISTPGSFSLNAANSSSQCYRINTSLPNEYFLLENRQKTGLDAALKGSGLAIWHINTNKTNLYPPSNTVNADEDLKGVDLEEADGLNNLDNDSGRGDTGDLFPGSSNNRTFSDFTNPNAKTYTNQNTGIVVKDITIDASGKAWFTFGNPSPGINDFTPVSAKRGAQVIINGKHLLGATEVRFNDVKASFSIINANTVVATVPASATSGFIKVITPGGTSTSATSFTVDLSNINPVASISSPANNAIYTAPASVLIQVTASDPDGTISKVEFFNGTTKIGEDVSSPYEYRWSNVGEGTYNLTAKAIDNLGASITSAAVIVKVNATQLACTATGSILREYWSNVTGTAVSTIPVNTTPSATSQLNSFEAPSNAGDNYGQRIRGYLCVPTTGNYTFYIAGDNNAELWLSSDDQAANRQRIAHISGSGSWTTSKQWTKFASQKSVAIALVAGRKYYIEALHKEEVGGDNMAVGWTLPNTSDIAVIAGSYLSPFVPVSGIAFYRAINLNGAAVTIDNRLYESGSSAANFSFTGRTFANQNISLSPAIDGSRATMIRSSVYASSSSPASLAIGGISAGEYELYVYVWEDNAAEAYNLTLEGKPVVSNYTTGGAGTWAKLGPFRTTISDGAINLVASGGGANLSGIEIWQVPMANASPIACTATGSILREYWSNVTGTAVSTIPVNTTPSATSQLNSFEAPSNAGDNYGQRIRGYLCVPTTGNYTFYIAGDNNAELWLSSDDQAANRQRIAHISGSGSWTTSKQWTKFASQKSVAIALVAGRKYYIEALHKEEVGGDNMAVGWTLPNTSDIAVIAGSYLSPFVPSSNARMANEAEIADQTRIVAYPNPFADKLALAFSGHAGKVVVTVIDITGKQYYHTSIQVDAVEEWVELDLSGAGLKAGLYFIKLQGEDGKNKMVRVIKN